MMNNNFQAKNKTNSQLKMLHRRRRQCIPERIQIYDYD